MRQLPQAIQPDGIYRSDELAEFWQMSRLTKAPWYRVLRVSVDPEVGRAGDHYIITGRAALATLAKAGSESSDSKNTTST